MSQQIPKLMFAGSGKSSVKPTKHRQINVIEPNKCIVEDMEILAFESEEQLNYYTIWHEALMDKRREMNAESERERQIIRNEIARKTRQLIGNVTNTTNKERTSSKIKITTNGTSKSSSRRVIPNSSPIRASSTTANRQPASKAHAAAPSNSMAGDDNMMVRTLLMMGDKQPGKHSVARQSATSHQRQGSASLPNGLTILNSSHFNTMPCGKQMLKYKLTKLYNKYRGRQLRRNFVIEKQKSHRIEVEISKSYLNSWLAYTALQALRLPEQANTLNTTTNNSSKILTPMTYQPNAPTQLIGSPKKTKSSPKKSQQQQQQQPQMHNQTGQQGAAKQPMHLVYIDPGNIITYSNRIYPQQVAEYRQKSHLLPTSATSKKSSAASYDAYEIMEVLANTSKTNVTITRNANRPSQTAAGGGGSAASIYSHSVNANTHGIVSTQLHLQARTYLDSMSKFYAEEWQRLEKEKEEMKREPPIEDLISRYLYIDTDSKPSSSKVV